jgi:hypothetical protein
MEYEDGFTVTELKLVHFMQYVVHPRGRKPPGEIDSNTGRHKKKPKSSNDGETPASPPEIPPPLPLEPWAHNYSTKAEMICAKTREPESMLSYEGYQGYIKPIVKLYTMQVSRNINSHPKPRGDLLKKFLDSKTKQKTRNDRESFVDRGLHRLLDGYGSKMPELCDYMLSNPKNQSINLFIF